MIVPLIGHIARTFPGRSYGRKEATAGRECAQKAGRAWRRYALRRESSSSNVPLSPGSEPHDPDATIIDVGFSTPDPGATMVDLDATLVPGMLTAKSPTPASPNPARRQMSGLFVSAAVLQIGDVLGDRYEILQLLGEGGMGAVYKSSDRELGRPVALKVIARNLHRIPQSLRASSRSFCSPTRLPIAMRFVCTTLGKRRV